MLHRTGESPLRQLVVLEPPIGLRGGQFVDVGGVRGVEPRRGRSEAARCAPQVGRILCDVVVAPGVDLERDVLALMDFAPIIHAPPRLMDARIFRHELMQLRAHLLRLPLEQRFTFDAVQGIFFANFEGCTVRDDADVARIRALLEAKLQPLGRKVPAIVDYDNFNVLPDALDAFVDMAQAVAARHYSRVSRYTTSAFLRSKLGDVLRLRGVAPHIFESAADAHRHLVDDRGA